MIFSGLAVFVVDDKLSTATVGDGLDYAASMNTPE